MSDRIIFAGTCIAIILGVAATGALAAGGVVAGSTNIAAAANGGWVVSVSSQDRDENAELRVQWMAANAIDGLYVVGNHVPPKSYGWSTATPPSEENPHWIILAFDKEPKTHLISRVVIDPTTDDPSLIGRWVRNIEIQVSTTEKHGPYKRVAQHVVVNRPIKQAFDFPPVECRYLKLLILDNHGSDRCVELGEIEVYEAIVGEEELDQLIMRLENLLMDLKRYRDAQLYQQQKASAEKATAKPDPPPDTATAPAGGPGQ